MSQNPNSKLMSNGVNFTPTQHHDTYDKINPEQFDLSSKAVFITGPSKGVGHAAALSFARAGASFIGLGARSDMSSLEKEIQEVAQKAGRKAPQTLAVKLDVSNEENVASAAKEVESKFGRLDILVNNAGYLEGFVPIKDSKVEEWWKTWQINVLGVYLVTRAFLPLLLKGDMKTILNTSSIGAQVCTPGASAYQTTKLAVLRFGEFINAEYSKEGLHCYSFHPGAVATELALNMPKQIADTLKDTPQLPADFMVWLTAEKREFLAGRYLSATWDVDELLQKREQIEKNDLLRVRMDVGLE